MNTFLKFTGLQKGIFFSLFILSSSVGICACSAAKPDTSETSVQKVQGITSGEKVFTFTDTTNGGNNYYKVIFRADTISELYKNNRKIPSDKLDDYSDKIYSALGDVSWGRSHFFHSPWAKRFHSEFFNKDEMKKLSKELKRLKNIKIDINFDTSAFNENMKQLDSNLANMHFKMNFDWDKFHKNMRRMQEDLKNRKFNININMKDLQERMKALKEELKDLNIDLGGVDKKVDKFGEFTKSLKKELVKDGIIGNSGVKINVEMNSNEVTVNGKAVSGSLAKKCRELYKSYFGKYPEGNVKIIE